MADKSADSGAPVGSRNRDFFESGEGAIMHWKRITRVADFRAAFAAFLIVALGAAVAANMNFVAVRSCCLAASAIAGNPGAFRENGPTDFLSNRYLEGKIETSSATVVILGASYTHTSADRDPRRRLAARLQKRLNARSRGRYRVMSFAEDGYTNWSNFYLARKLRLARQPDVLIVGLDAFSRKPRDKNLFLNSGGGWGIFSARELAPVVQQNRLLLFECESKASRWLMRIFPSLEFARVAALGGGIRKLVIAAAEIIRGAPADEVVSGYKRPEMPASWRKSKSAQMKIKAVNDAGGIKIDLDEDAREDLEHLGAELAECKKAGIKVLVLTMPKNPAVKYDFADAHEYLTGWAARYGIPFHDYWTSGIVPDEYYVDTGHFFGQGAVIMARETARLLEGGEL